MQADEIADLLERIALFADLDEAERRDLKGAFRAVTFAPGALIFRQGGEPDGLYLMAEGRAAISVRLPGDDEIELTTVGPDDVLGEMALVDQRSRSASARALTETRAWFLDGRWFEAQATQLDPAIFKVLRRLALLFCARLRRTNQEVADALPSARLEAPAPSLPLTSENMRAVATGDRPLLRMLPLFEDFTDKELMALAKRMRRHELPRGRVLFTEGEPGMSCFITLWGAVEVSVDRGEKHRLAILGPGTMFGQLALLDGGLRSATCKVRERSVLLELDKATMDKLFTEGGPTAFKFMAVVLGTLSSARRGADAEMARLASIGPADDTAGEEPS